MIAFRSDSDSFVLQWWMRVRAPLSGAQAGRHCWVHWCGCEWLRRSPRYVADHAKISIYAKIMMIVSKHHEPFCFSFAGSFEIEINGKLIFSKLETSGFPYEDDVSKYLTTGQAGHIFTCKKFMVFHTCACISPLSHPQDYGCYPKSPRWPAGGEDHQEPASLCHPLKFHLLTLHFWLSRHLNHSLEKSKMSRFWTVLF